MLNQKLYLRFAQLILVIGLFLFPSFINAADTLKIIRLNEKALELAAVDTIEANKMLLEALSLSERYAYVNGVILSLKNIGNIQNKYGNHRNALKYLNKALSFARNIKSSSQVADISLLIGKTFNYLGDFNNAVYYLSQAEELYTGMENKAGLYEVLQTFSVVYQTNNNFYQALQYGLKALEISREYNDKEHVVLSLGNLGQIYSLLNQKNKAVEYYQQAIRIAENDANSTYLPLLYLSSGIILRDLGQTEQSVNYFLKAFGIFKQTENTNGMISCLTEIGKNSVAEKDNAKALNYFLRAKQLAESNDNYQKIIELNYEIAFIHFSSNNFQKALLYLDNNFTLAKSYNDIKTEARSLMQIGQYLLMKGDVSKSIETLSQSLQIAEKTKQQELFGEIYFYLANAFAQTGQFKIAFEQMAKSKSFSIDYLKSKEEDTFKMLEMIFELSNKQKDLELLRKSNQVEKYEKKQVLITRNIFIFGSIVLILLLIISFYAVQLFRRKNKTLLMKTKEVELSNSALMKMNSDLESQKNKLNELNTSLIDTNKKLRESEEELRMLNTTKDKLFSIIAHDLRSPFASVISFTRIMKRDIDKMKKHDIQALTAELEKTADQINYLLENLLQWSMSQTGKIRYKPEPVKLHELVGDTIDLFSGVTSRKGVLVVNKTDDSDTVNADKSMLSAVLRNFISNALKFSPSGNKIIVESVRQNKKLLISIIDEGVGMTQEQIDNLFKVDKNKSTQGTDSERGSGLGLLICNEFLEKHNTKIKVQSKPGVGTTFSFYLQLI